MKKPAPRRTAKTPRRRTVRIWSPLAQRLIFLLETIAKRSGTFAVGDVKVNSLLGGTIVPGSIPQVGVDEAVDKERRYLPLTQRPTGEVAASGVKTTKAHFPRLGEWWEGSNPGVEESNRIIVVACRKAPKKESKP
jgi:hypothetical protein